MSVPDRTALLDHDHEQISVRRQCRLLGLARSGVYRERRPANDNDLGLMRRIDELFEGRHAHAMASSPGATKSAGVLATVKDKPLRARPKRRVLDRRCARRPAQCVGRDEGTASCGAAQRNSTTREDKTSSHHMP